MVRKVEGHRSGNAVLCFCGKYTELTITLTRVWKVIYGGDQVISYFVEMQSALPFQTEEAGVLLASAGGDGSRGMHIAN